MITRHNIADFYKKKYHQQLDYSHRVNHYLANYSDRNQLTEKHMGLALAEVIQAQTDWSVSFITRDYLLTKEIISVENARYVSFIQGAIIEKQDGARVYVDFASSNGSMIETSSKMSETPEHNRCKAFGAEIAKLVTEHFSDASKHNYGDRQFYENAIVMQRITSLQEDCHDQSQQGERFNLKLHVTEIGRCVCPLPKGRIYTLTPGIYATRHHFDKRLIIHNKSASLHEAVKNESAPSLNILDDDSLCQEKESALLQPVTSQTARREPRAPISYLFTSESAAVKREEEKEACTPTGRYNPFSQG